MRPRGRPRRVRRRGGDAKTPSYSRRRRKKPTKIGPRRVRTGFGRDPSTRAPERRLRSPSCPRARRSGGRSARLRTRASSTRRSDASAAATRRPTTTVAPEGIVRIPRRRGTRSSSRGTLTTPNSRGTTIPTRRRSASIRPPTRPSGRTRTPLAPRFRSWRRTRASGTPPPAPPKNPRRTPDPPLGFSAPRSSSRSRRRFGVPRRERERLRGARGVRGAALGGDARRRGPARVVGFGRGGGARGATSVGSRGNGDH